MKKETDFCGSRFSFIRTVKGRNLRGNGNCALRFRGLGFHRSGKGTFGVEDSTCRAVPLHLEVINTVEVGKLITCYQSVSFPLYSVSQLTCVWGLLGLKFLCQWILVGCWTR